MESNQQFIIFMIATYLMVSLPNPVFAKNDGKNGVPSETQMIQRRLLTDMRDLKSKVDELTRTVNKLKHKIRRLRQTNHRQENHIQDLKSQRREVSKVIKKLQAMKDDTISESRREVESKSVKTNQHEDSVSGDHQQKPTGSKTEREMQSREVPLVHAQNEQEYSQWKSSDSRDYQILEKPLDQRIFYITDKKTILTELAHKFYHNASYYFQIYSNNKDKLPGPDVVPPGKKLVLPPLNKINS